MAKPVRQLNLGGAKAVPQARGVDYTQFVARYAMWLSILGAVLVLAAGYFFLIRPKLAEVTTDASHGIETLELEVSRRTEHLKKLEALATRLRGVSNQDIEKLHKILPDKKGVADLLVQLQALATENGFTLLAVSMGEQGAQAERAGGATVQRMSISLTLNGPDYAQFKRLLAAIEQNLRLFDVNAVYFSPGSPEYTLQLFTYYAPGR